MKRATFLFIWLSIVSISFAQTGIQIQNGPYLQNHKETETTIVWQTNKASIGWVEVAIDDGSHFYYKERPQYYNSTNGLKNVTQTHQVNIKGLQPGTKYRYRVYSEEVLKHNGMNVSYGNTIATTVYNKKPLTFVTNDREKKETSFLMISDIHEKSDELTSLLKAGNYQEKELIIYNGDMVNHLTNEDVLYNGFMKTTVELFAKEKPMYYARGNHETRGALAPAFQDYFSCGEEHLYYMFRQGPVCFIVLDSGEDKADTDIEYGGIADFDSYRSEQANWLNKVLQTKEYKDAAYKVVICHMPPTPQEGLWHGQKEISDKFVPLLNKVKVDIMLSSHLHEYLREEASEHIQFPVIINSNNTVVTAITEKNTLKFEVLDMKGKLIDKLNIKVK